MMLSETEVALRILRVASSTQFDPALVEVFYRTQNSLSDM